MIVVIASAWDAASHALVERWVDPDARVLTPADLSQPGWRWHVGTDGPGMAVIGGTIVSTQAIRGVVTRLPWVSEDELPHVAAHDRAYVSAEMHAFLFAWLGQLTCPLLNRPSPYCLSGPSWRQEKWLHAAAQLGIPIRRAQRVVCIGAPMPPARVDDTLSVTVVGQASVGCDNPRLVEQTRLLAGCAGVELLTAYYSRTEPAELLSVSLWPDIRDATVADAIVRYFSSHSEPS